MSRVVRRWGWHRRAGTPEHGSVLMLFPAAILVVFALGVISVDAASTYLARRALIDRVTSSADDAAAKAIDLRAFYQSPSVLRIDPVEADQVVADLAAVQRRDGGVVLVDESSEVSPDGRHVTVRATGRVQHVFAFGLARRTVTVRAQATATVTEVRQTG